MQRERERERERECRGKGRRADSKGCADSKGLLGFYCRILVWIEFLRFNGGGSGDGLGFTERRKE